MRDRAPELGDLLAALPRTECGQCGFGGCAPYAHALREGRARADACPPGGAVTRQRLLRLLGKEALPVARAEMLAPLPPPQLARIDEDLCIGCAKCLDACPVDALVGAPRQLHAVLDEACTGCGLCLPPCPVDCIEILSRPVTRWPTPETVSAQCLASTAAEPCTACGDCAPACPEGLDPGGILAALERLDTDAAAARRLAACTGCGACDAVCPSGIPLAATFAHGVLLAAATEEATAAARRAADRHAARMRRQAEPAGAREAHELPDLVALDDAQARREIDAALRRVRQQRQSDAYGA